MARSLTFITLAILCLLPWGNVPAAAGAEISGATERAVEARSRAWIKVELDGDADAFRTFATDGYLLLSAEPKTTEHPARWVTETRDQWEQEIRTRQVRYRSVELRNTKVRLDGDIAFFTGEYTEKGIRAGTEYTESGLFVETWTKRSGLWLAMSSVFP